MSCTEVDPASKIGLGTSGSIVGLKSALIGGLELEFESAVGSTEVGLATELLEGDRDTLELIGEMKVEEPVE